MEEIDKSIWATYRDEIMDLVCINCNEFSDQMYIFDDYPWCERCLKKEQVDE